jgi:hypothetical protein
MTQLGDELFQRAFQVTQLTTVEGIILLAFEQEAGGRNFVPGKPSGTRLRGASRV